MIKQITTTTTETAICDVCGSSLVENELGNVNYAKVASMFGYGSPLDDLATVNPQYDLCERCYQDLCQYLDGKRIDAQYKL